jgi:lipopolysaccharide transport system permease protein
VSDTAQETWTIVPRTNGPRARALELWRYRRMFRFFAHRAVAKLYKNTVLGAAWIVLRPVIPLVIRALLFGGILDVSSHQGTPYFLFVAVGSAAWELFGSAAMWATRSIELNGGLLTRMYVPRLILPIATIAPGLVSFGVSLGVLVVTVVYYRVREGIWYLDPHWMFVAPIALTLMLLLALSIGLWTSVMAVGARDVRFGLGYALDFWVYLTPVVYPLSKVPEHLQWLMMLNPMSVLVVAFRGALLGGEGPTPIQWATAVVTIGCLLAAGLSFFQRAEAEAVDNL